MREDRRNPLGKSPPILSQWEKASRRRPGRNRGAERAAAQSIRRGDSSEGWVMSKLAVSTRARPGGGSDPTGDVFVRAFNEVRAELVSTLFFVLGNHDDAQDAAQDAFLKCWRKRGELKAVRNLRAWIFRVGLNAAKD